MSCAIVILNYNDLENTLRLYQELKDFSVLSRIYIVDNASTDSSRQIPVFRKRTLKMSYLYLKRKNRRGWFPAG